MVAIDAGNGNALMNGGLVMAHLYLDTYPTWGVV